MICPDCGGTGYQMVDVGTATLPDYIEARCRCNPAPTDEDRTYFFDALGWDEREDGTYGPTDEDAPDWEPRGTAYDDFHPTTYLYGTE